MKKSVENLLKSFSLRTIIMIFCSSFILLVISVSAIFYFTGTRHMSGMIRQNAMDLTRQATENLSRKLERLHQSAVNSVTHSLLFLRMNQNMEAGLEPVSAKNYTLLAAGIQEFVTQNHPDISTAILMLSNNSIVLTVSDYGGILRWRQPDYSALYDAFSSSELTWIGKDTAAEFIGTDAAVPQIGLIQMLGTESSPLHGLLYIGFSDQAIEKELDCYHVTNSNFFTIARGGKFLFLSGEDSPFAGLSRLAVPPDTGNAVSLFNLEDFCALYSPMSVPDLSIVALIPGEELFLDNARFSSVLLAESAAAVGLCLLLFVIVTKLISSPAENLARQLDSVESLRQLETVKAVGGKDFLQISAAINHLYGRVNHLIASLTDEMQSRRDAQLKVLYAQINPHFLYNTLDSIGQLCHLGDTEAACLMVRQLSDFYRIGVSKGETLIPLKDELLHVSSYLSILRTRFEDFQYRIQVPENLLDIPVPKIILQPLAENAVCHGLRTFCACGTVEIRASVQNQMLLLQVTDDGAGIDEDRLEQIRTLLYREPVQEDKFPPIYGLKNVHQRITLQYGQPFGLTIDSRLDEGTQVEIRLPLTSCQERNLNYENSVC